MKNNVAFFISNDFPEGTAKNARIKAYCAGLNQLGFNCKVYVGFSSSFNKTNINSQVSGEWENIPFQFLVRDVTPPSSLLKKITTVIRANITCLKKLWSDKEHYAVFYMPSLKGIGVAFFIASFFHKKRIAIQTERFSLVQTGMSKWISKIDEFLISRLANRILVISNHLKSYYLGLNYSCLIDNITPVVVDYERFDVEINRSPDFKIGYVGTFNEKDGVDTIIKSFEHLKLESPQAELILMGNSDHFDRVETKGVQFSGKFKHKHLATMLMRCSALVVNRLDDIYSRTGFPIKLAEYLATKRPVLLCDFEEYHEFLEPDEVIYFKPNDHKDLYNKMIWVEANPIEAAAIGLKGYEKGKILFDKETAALQLKHIFANID